MTADAPLVARDIRAVDLCERGVPRLTSGYYISAPRPAIVDTGAARSVPVWVQALSSFGVSPADVAFVIVTHIHLDHAGGVGLLLPHLPNARVVVHPRGARHLADPSRLIAGARAVFGANLETWYGVPAPVPESRVQSVEDRAELDLGQGHLLRFFDAPGHARHQHMILDTGSGCLFSADELGGRLPDIADDYVIPDTAPNQFDPDAMLRSAELARELQPEAILFSHFGRYPRSVEVLHDRLVRTIDAFTALGRTGDRRATVEEVEAALAGHIRDELARRGIQWTPEIREFLAERIEVSAQGIADYHTRRGAVRPAAADRVSTTPPRRRPV